MPLDAARSGGRRPGLRQPACLFRLQGSGLLPGLCRPRAVPGTENRGNELRSWFPWAPSGSGGDGESHHGALPVLRFPQLGPGGAVHGE